MACSRTPRRPRHAAPHVATAALVLLAAVGSSRQVSAADLRVAQADAPGWIGVGSVSQLVIDPALPTRSWLTYPRATTRL